MHILESHPESGVRVILNCHPDADGRTYTYEGKVETPRTAYAVTAFVERDGGVRVDSREGLPPQIAIKVRALVMAACMRGRVSDTPPPRIHRWMATGMATGMSAPPASGLRG